MNAQDKARGMLVGLAVGDALGAPVEFGYSSSDIVALGDKIAHFQPTIFGPAGSWTDDTSMALCLADSLLECGGYDSYDIMDRYWRWMTEGYRTYDGEPAKDVGGQTRRAIYDFHKDPVVHLDTPKTESAGNGAIMRLAPVVIASLQADKGSNAQKLAALSCRETHDSDMAMAVTEAFACALSLLFSPTFEHSADSAIGHSTCWLGSYGGCDRDVRDAVNQALDPNDGTDYRDLGGYILDAFSIAIWGLARSKRFEEGMLAVIRLGGDTDTNAAIYGQLAGAYYGYEAIPKEWREGVHGADELVGIADRLLEMKCPILRTRFEDERHFKKPEEDVRQGADPVSLKEILKNYKLKEK